MEQCSTLKKDSKKKSKVWNNLTPLTGAFNYSDCGGKLSYREPAEHKEKEV